MSCLLFWFQKEREGSKHSGNSQSFYFTFFLSRLKHATDDDTKSKSTTNKNKMAEKNSKNITEFCKRLRSSIVLQKIVLRCHPGNFLKSRTGGLA